MPSVLPLPLQQRLLTTALRHRPTTTTTTPTAITRATLLQASVRTYKQKAISPPIPSPTGTNLSIPPYPLGERQVYKQSNTGLYGSQRIRFGNRVSSKYEVKTRRKWRPNVQRRRLWSDALGVFVRTRVTTRVLRTLDKVGGLDEYLLGGKTARLRELGPWGWRLRWRLMQAPAVRDRFRREREALGLPPLPDDAAAEIPAELVADGLTAAELIEETDRMIEEEGEFALGGEGEGEAGGEAEGFMKEANPSAPVGRSA